ncbi:hypothetical protein [uncultured Muriicola sp.]|uniref:hypothetical protein n=1 Tax=uncultured Muriicola sp. TaxID=1583102 RepID=UPI00261E5AAA|nr:hypothetical protein [uncultured Muriicola sp.]
MRHLSIILACILLYSCGDPVTKEDLTFLDGYWEIKQVKFPNGDTKTYEINATVDYIEVTGTKGYRKKVQPLIDGSFETSDDAEYFSISERDGSFFMVYKSAMADWEEEIKSIAETELRLVNEEQITYIYERFQPITLE